MIALREKITATTKRGETPQQDDIDRFREIEKGIVRHEISVAQETGRELAKYVKENDIDFVGFKLWTGSGFENGMHIAADIKKENPDTLIVAGGPHPDLFGEMIFEVTNIFDMFATGEGENTILQIAEYCEGRRPIAEIDNIIYKEDNSIKSNQQVRVSNLEDIPLPCYDEDIYPAMTGNKKIKVVLLDESRGCPNSCHFCHHPHKSGQNRRLSSGKHFVDKLESMIEKYGMRAFRFAGSNPPGKLRREISEEIIKRDLDVIFSGFAHVRGSNIEDFALFKKAGCRVLSYGVESGSQEILDKAMNKKVKIEKMVEVLKACKASGLDLVVSVIVPAPFDTEATKQETLDFLCEIQPTSTFVSFPIMMIGTDWEMNRKHFGFNIIDRDSYHKKTMTHRFNSFTPAELWAPIEDYKLDDRDSVSLMRETGEFIHKMHKNGLATQIHDQEILIAELAGMPAAEFHKLTSSYLADGEIDKLEELMEKINSNAIVPAPVY
ncbi:MAG: B12-binding domain-containing radical SAM protein [Planctomycetota bacterium]|jgi:radical SAM superfamily enzyme YgiQ (UPF0313 family)